jgi:hypothetical protein
MTLKHLPPNLFNELADYRFDRRFAVLPPGTTFEDLFIPTLWAHYANKWKKYDIIRVVAEDGEFDVNLTVENVAVGGITMKPWPHFRGASGDAAVVAASKAAEAGRMTEVPLDKAGKPKVYVEHLPATNWRVVGLNGEVSRDHKTKAEAEKAMDKYLKESGLVLAKPAGKPDKKDAA